MTVVIDIKAKISPLADIEDSIKGTRIEIGENSIIESFVKIKPTGGTGDVIIGKNCTINSCCTIYSGNGIRIGNNVAIAANCVFAPVNHEYKSRKILIREQRFKISRGGIIIEDDVWIGASCVVLDGAVLKKGCVIGAMSLVRGEIFEYSIQAGNPIKLIGFRE